MKKAIDIDSLEDYDIERIADKIEDTGRIAIAVHREVSDQLREFTKLLDAHIDGAVKKNLRKSNLEMNEDVVKAEVTLKLIKKILEDEA